MGTVDKKPKKVKAKVCSYGSRVYTEGKDFYMKRYITGQLPAPGYIYKASYKSDIWWPSVAVALYNRSLDKKVTLKSSESLFASMWFVYPGREITGDPKWGPICP